MIAVDWGTSNFRAFRLDGSGRIVERHFSAMGLLRVAPNGFQDVLREQIADWLDDGETTLMLCGMVGSRSGWVEIPYVTCPAARHDLVICSREIPFDGARAWIVPGVECTIGMGIPEVMRGEETAILGALHTIGCDGLVCLPGTHSKWVRIADGKLQSFRTSMTGEVFSALRQHTILAQSAGAERIDDMDAFAQGVEHAAQTGGLLHHLFRVRTMALKGTLPEASGTAFLSGLLIGSEVRAMLPEGEPVLLLGAESLCRLYAAAISLCDGRARFGGDESAAQGLFQLGREIMNQHGEVKAG